MARGGFSVVRVSMAGGGVCVARVFMAGDGISVVGVSMAKGGVYVDGGRGRDSMARISVSGGGLRGQAPGPHSPYGVAVAKVQGRDNLSEELACLLGGKTSLLHQVVEKLPS